MNLTKYKKYIPNLLTFIGIVFLLFAFGPLIIDEVWFRLKEFRNQELRLEDDTAQEDSVFARFLTTRPISIKPVNKDFSIVIEKIGVNVPIVVDVPVTNEKAYLEALKWGVAHASVSKYPSKNPGNTYLFAHASLNFWRLGKYANVFNLLRKLEIGDRVHIFFERDIYVYEVVNSEVVKGWNVNPIDRAVIEPILTLQTCHPPGTTFNRLVVTAKLIEVNEAQQYIN
ncbi:sortase [Patescibacteria group bacterium]